MPFATSVSYLDVRIYWHSWTARTMALACTEILKNVGYFRRNFQIDRTIHDFTTNYLCNFRSHVPLEKRVFFLLQSFWWCSVMWNALCVIIIICCGISWAVSVTYLEKIYRLYVILPFRIVCFFQSHFLWFIAKIEKFCQQRGKYVSVTKMVIAYFGMLLCAHHCSYFISYYPTKVQWYAYVCMNIYEYIQWNVR